MAEDALAAVDAGADAVGINFYSGSSRFCTREAAASIVSAVSSSVTVFGVFVRAGREVIEQTIEATGIGGVQLHGGEMGSEAEGWGLPVLRALAAGSAEINPDSLQSPDYRVLIDSPAGGGSGQRWKDEAVSGLPLDRAVIAGGLNPQNVGSVVSRLSPFGVDVAGGVEKTAGVKDHELIREFIQRARTA
jgi:phosphoribosylanthranilate isomerase